MFKFKINIEIPMALGVIGALLSGSVYTNFLIYRTCYADLGYNESDCGLLGSVTNNITKHLEPIVESQITVMSTARSFVDSIFIVLVALIVGPWSDKFGRKPIMVMGAIGGVISALAMLLISYLRHLSGWFVCFSHIPGLVIGGGIASISAISSYIVDTTAEEHRGLRFTLLNIIMMSINMIGNAVSSYIFEAIGYSNMFLITLLCSFLSMLYTIFFIKESVKCPEKGKINNLLDISHFKNMVKVAVQKREKYNRLIILLMIAYTINMSLYVGAASLNTLFMRNKFGWTLKKCNLYTSVISGLSVAVVSSAVYILHKLLSIGESRLVTLGLCSSLIGSLLRGFATNDYFVYAAGSIETLGGIVDPMQKSMLSTLIPLEDIGKLFSLLMIVAFIFGLGATPVFNFVYKKTLDTDPGFYNFLGAGFVTLNIVVFIVVLIFERISNNLKNEENVEESVPPKFEDKTEKF